MIIVNPNPAILKLGSFTLSYYLLVVILAFLTITLILLKKKKQFNLTEEQVYDLVIFSILGTIIGARIFHILFWGLDYYSQNPIKIFYIWEGGLSFHGGLIGAAVVSIVYCKLKKISFYKIADTIIIPATFFLALARIANFMNSEILGITTKLPWCVIFQNIDNICRHPIQLYAAIGKLALFLYLLSIKKFKNYKPGLICWMFILLISIGRFPLDFLRDDPRLYGLAPGQWFSLILIIISIIALKKLNFLDKKLNQKDYRSIWSEAA